MLCIVRLDIPSWFWILHSSKVFLYNSDSNDEHNSHTEENYNHMTRGYNYFLHFSGPKISIFW